MHWLIFIYWLLLFNDCFADTCTPAIRLKARPGQVTHVRWVNVSTLLTCPAGVHNTSMWFSSREVYKMTVGCQDEEESSLELDWFPDVENITAIFLSHITNMETKCVYYSNEGIIRAMILPETPIVGPPNELRSTIYIQPNQMVKHEFFICKQGVVRNGTCRTQYPNGTYDRGKQRIQTGGNQYKITDELRPIHLEKHECFVNIDRKYHFISILFKHDVNECAEAEALGMSLCATGTCIDRWTGYTCSDNDYINLHMCHEKSDWFCPSNTSYDYMGVDECPINKCIEAANRGLQLCDGGVEDCENTNVTYRCRRGVPLLDECNIIGEEINLRCPQLTKDTPNLESFGSTLQRIAYNARALRDVDPDYFLGLTEGLTDNRLKQDIEQHSEEERHQMANRLLDTLAQTLDSDVEIHNFSTTELLRSDDGATQLEFQKGVSHSLGQVLYEARVTSETQSAVASAPKPVSAVKKIRTASALLHMLATLARRSQKVRHMFDKGQANRNGIQFWRMPTERNSAEMNNSDGGATVLTITHDKIAAASEDKIVAMLPSSKLKETPLVEDDSSKIGDRSFDKYEEIEKPSVVQSDVLLIDTHSLDSTYHVSMNLTKKPRLSATCHQLQHSAGSAFSQWSDELCETIVAGLHYECRCKPRARGTFAIALVYWIGNAEIPPEHEYVITLVNYIFTSITIVALLLFLIFTRFVGVFRLDQFNIAFCLMLSAIVSLIIPFVSPKQPVGCVILAIAVCFFPLAAFSWKFIFGLNTLILIVAPHSRYHDLVSRHQHCVPLVWIGYIVPALIVGAWFGYAEKVYTQKFCIGPQELRWLFIGPITAVVIFNFIVLIVVGIVLLRSYLLTRKSRLNKSTHLLVLTQLMLTLGIPYVAIYIQFLDPYTMLIVVPVAMALTAVLMFLLVAVIDEENRQLLQSFIRARFTRSTSVPPSGPGTQGSQLRGKMGQTPDSIFSSAYAPPNHKPFTPGKRANRSKWFCHDRNPGKAESDPQTAERIKLNGQHGNGHGTGQTYSETVKSEMTFEPGWLHRYPATTIMQNGRTTPIDTNSSEIRSSVPSVALPSSVGQDIQSVNYGRPKLVAPVNNRPGRYVEGTAAHL